ncbi:hypothetical protein RB195_007165 [Necator americanus]|uniref:Uncharacterized protein n=1 Tax=Necator americanus TaxID=51031 RepID=A0ABR1BYT4_NECAM
MSSTLPTTPIGKEQLIDMRAGAILRGHARKSERYLGCPVRLLLTFIVLIKSSLLCAWLVREYYFFDVRCSFLSASLENDLLKKRSLEVLRIPVFASDPPAVNYFDEEHHRRVKRTVRGSERSDPRMKSRRERKKSNVADLQGIPTTVVTLTNTQLLPADGDTLRMKTIRNRVEPMNDVAGDEDLVEIDIDAPPRVYISKILTRGELLNDADTTTEKPQKRKGKGKKKKKKLGQKTTTSTTAVTPITKKRKGHRKKQNTIKEYKNISEQTKSPRHLFSSPGLPQYTTPRPHQSNFLHGVIDPRDPQFSNKGQIRGYPMHIASRKPTPSTRLSEETRLMWEMDELNYTTFVAAPKTTVVTDVKEKKEEESPIISVVQLILPEVSEAPPTTEASKRKTFYSTHTLSTWKLTETPSSTSTTPAPITKILWVAEGVLTEEEKRLHEEIPVQKVHREKSTLEKLSNESPTTTIHSIKVTPERPRPRPVKHGFDRSLDKAIDAGLLTYPSLDSSNQKEYEDDGNFQV